MVYCGRPSKGCHACRRRKTKCDAAPKGCTQCKNAGRVCPGYRSQVDLMFHDQNEKLTKKARKHQQQNNSTRQHKTSDTADVLDVTPSKPAASLSVPVEETALCLFMSNFAGGMTVPSAGGMIFTSNGMGRIIPPLYSIETVDEILRTSLEATSLAYLAHHTCQQHLKDVAQARYVRAITLTDQALGCGDVTNDSVLLSINLLALFETISGLSKRSMRATADHIKGAAVLLQLRGAEQFETPLGRQAFLQTVHNLLMSCLQWNLKLPEDVIQMTEDFMAKTQQHSRRAKLFLAMLTFTQFRHDVRRSRRVSGIQNILEGALQIDAPFADFCDHPDESAQYEAFCNNSLSPVFVHEGHYHVYRLVEEARLWNHIRIFRITIHQLICESLLSDPASSLSTQSKLGVVDEQAAQFQRSTVVCKELSADMVASVPQQLGLVNESGTRQHSYTAKITNEDSLLQQTSYTSKGSTSKAHLCGYPLIWPLWIAAAVPMADDGIRAYCTRMLQMIGVEMGIKHALVLAGLLRAMKNMTVKIWTDDTIDF